MIDWDKLDRDRAKLLGEPGDISNSFDRFSRILSDRPPRPRRPSERTYVDPVVIEMMPEDLRESHRSARNWGQYPHNGAVRVIAEREVTQTWRCVDGEWLGIETDEYDRVLRDATPQDLQVFASLSEVLSTST